MYKLFSFILYFIWQKIEVQRSQLNLCRLHNSNEQKSLWLFTYPKCWHLVLHAVFVSSHLSDSHLWPSYNWTPSPTYFTSMSQCLHRLQPPTCFASALTTASLPCWDPVAAPGLHILNLSHLTPGLLCPNPAWNHTTLLTSTCPSLYPLRLDSIFPSRWPRTERDKFILTHAEGRVSTQEPGTVAQSLQMLSNLAFETKRV